MFTERSLIIQQVAKGSFYALIIKLAAAALSFLMFLVAARVLDEDNYGMFGVGMSSATLLVLAGSLGQRLLMLRFIPVYQVENRRYQLKQLVLRGYRLVVAGTFALALSYICASIAGAVQISLDVAVAIGLLSIAIAIAEYQAHVLRGLGNIILALLSRDVIWYFAVIVVLIGAFSVGVDLQASDLLMSMAGLLMLATTVQWLMSTELRGSINAVSVTDQNDISLWKEAARSFWLTGLLRAATANLAVILVALYLTTADAAAYFAAFRLAVGVNLLIVAANILCRPLLSRAFSKGDPNEASVICGIVSITAGVPAMVITVSFFVYGQSFLSFFSPAFTQSHQVLQILAVGYLLKVLLGPGSAALQMMGKEALFMKVSLFTSGFALLSLIPSILYFGALGAACTVAFEIAFTALTATVVAAKSLGVNVTFLGAYAFFRGKRL